MLLRRSLALCFLLVLCLRPVFAQSQAPASPAQPHQPQEPMAAAAPLSDPAAYLAQEFGPTFKLVPEFPPMRGDFNGDGVEDIVLFATSSTPLLSRELFNFRVEDPYNTEFGTADVSITSQFSLHFDGSNNDVMIVFGWQQPPEARKTKRVSKFVLINIPFETVSMVSMRYKKKDIQAIKTLDRTRLHSVVFWNGKHWVFNPQGMDTQTVPSAR